MTGVQTCAFRSALKFYKEAALAGFIHGQFYLGLQYTNGDLVEQDEYQAFSWFRLAADAGDPAAQYYVARFYQQGVGVEQSIESALEWFQQAAKQNLADAQIELGKLYFEGNQVTQDTFLAMEWFFRAAANGDIEAQYTLGRLYSEGSESGDILRNPHLANKWLRLAADQGHTLARNELENLKRIQANNRKKYPPLLPNSLYNRYG